MNLKKLIALIITAVMMMTMVSALAADPDYTITINNNNSENVSIIGKTYKAYKVFDLVYSGTNTTADSDTNPHAYSIKNTSWAWDYVKGSLKTGSTTVYENAEYGLTFTPTAADPTVYSITSTMTAEQARKMADVLALHLPSEVSGSVEATAETNNVIKVNDGPGYYAVYGAAKPVNPSQDPAEEVVAALALTSTDPAAIVNPKVSIPTLDKKITSDNKLDEAGNAAAAEIGSTVNFQLDSIVPDLTGYSDYVFKITDTMSSGLTFTDPDGEATNDVAVKVDGTDKTEDCTISISGQTLTITIPYAKLTTYTKGKAIIVTYSAVLNSNALTTDYEKNTAKLTYSNNPTNAGEGKPTVDTPEDTVFVIDVDINVDKIAGGTSGKLANAKFKVFKGDTTPGDAEEKWYKWDATTQKVTWVAKTNADEFVTGTDGKFNPNVRGLDAQENGSNYGLLEIEAPAGYNLLDAPVIVTLTGAYKGTEKTATVTSTNTTVTNGTVKLDEAAKPNQPLATAEVENNTGVELPSTGGIGTTMFYIIGGLMVLAAGIVLVSRKKAAE